MILHVMIARGAYRLHLFDTDTYRDICKRYRYFSDTYRDIIFKICNKKRDK